MGESDDIFISLSTIFSLLYFFAIKLLKAIKPKDFFIVKRQGLPLVL